MLGKVHGQVGLQGLPLEAGIVGFSNRQTGVNMTANLDADGRFEVSMAEGFGLPPGQLPGGRLPVYRRLADRFQDAAGVPRVSEHSRARYRSPETSGLSLDVHEGDNPLDIDMQPSARALNCGLPGR